MMSCHVFDYVDRSTRSEIVSLMYVRRRTVDLSSPSSQSPIDPRDNKRENRIFFLEVGNFFFRPFFILTNFAVIYKGNVSGYRTIDHYSRVKFGRVDDKTER